MPATKEQIDAAIKDLAKDLEPVVQEIESGLKTTQNHYGRYMSILTMAGNEPDSMRLIALALVEAGANHAGVKSAMKIHQI